MKCIYCHSPESKVIDSRLNDDGLSIRRRRECSVCKRRFTTYEKVEIAPIMVIKRNGNRQTFDSSKIKAGILKAIEKRPVSVSQVDEIISKIEKELSNSLVQEVSSKKIGEMVMRELKDIDDVSYVRFASVHREFKDLETFMKEILNLVKDK
ncbi:MAG: transcriptional regulator NrdR [Christensenellales bacterium]|jgi:transcriptional repressor NrdR